MPRTRLSFMIVGFVLFSVIIVMALELPPATVRIYVEDSPAVQQLVEQALTLRDQDRVIDAIEIYHRINTEYPGRLMKSNDDVYEDAEFWVRRQLLNDEELLSVYRRIYEPQASRGLELAGSNTDYLESLNEVFSQYLLTPSGLEAGLILASLYMERADFVGAGDVLDQLQSHPDLAQSSERYYQLQATAGLLSGEHERFEAYRLLLEEHGYQTALEAIDTLVSRLHPPLRLSRLAECGLMDGGEEPVALSKPLWRQVMPRVTSDLVYRSILNQGLRAARNQYDAATHLPVLPATSLHVLYVNDGEQLHAMDRRSGRRLWLYDWWEGLDYEMKVKLNRASRIVPDKRGVLVMGERVYAVLGRALESRLRNMDAGDLTVLVGMDKLSGELLWQVRPSELDAGFTNAYFLGTPVEGYGSLFVMVHRSQMTGFQDTFLAALDADTGRPLWRRHISSTMSAARQGLSLTPQMSVSGGKIYVYDNQGALACINGRNGSMEWLHVLEEVEEDLFIQRNRVNASTREPVVPVVVESGVLLMHPSRDIPAMLVDNRYGRKLTDLDSPMWQQVKYCQRAGCDVLLLGTQVILLDGGSLEPKWQVPVSENSNEMAIGQAAVTRQYVVVSTRREYMVISMSDGRVLARVANEDEPGNIHVLEDQLVVAAATSIRAYMQWDDAYDDVISQIQSEPDNVRVGLSLAHLAISLGREKKVVEGFDYALAALEHGQFNETPRDPVNNESQRDELISQLLSFVESSSGASTGLRLELFDRLARSTSGPAEEVAYHLAIGKFMEEQSQWPDAVEHYQAVLLDSTLAQQYFVYEGNRRQAARESRRRLKHIVLEKGRQVYARYDAMASQRFSEVTSRSGHNADELIEIVDQYPLAKAGVEALYLAAEMYATEGNINATVNQLRRAYQYTDDEELLAMISGKLAEHYVQNHYPVRAMHWLRRVKREYPGLQPVREGLPVSIDTWLADLMATKAAEGLLPAYQLPPEPPRVVSGTIVSRAANVITRDDRQRDLIVSEAEKIKLLNGIDLSEQWTFNAGKDDWELLAANDERVLLWSDAGGEVLALDGNTGKMIWPAVTVGSILDEVGKAPDDDRNMFIEDPAVRQLIQVDPFIELNDLRQRQTERLDNQYFLGVGESVICLTDRYGRIAAMDIHTGDVLWRMMCQIKVMTTVAMSEYFVAIAGARELSSDELSGNIWVVDQVTGEQVLPMIALKDSPQWLGFVGEDLLLVAMGNDLTAYKLSDGVVAWQTTIAGRPLDGSLRDEDNLLLIINNTGVLSVVDLETGETDQHVNMYSLVTDRVLQIEYIDQRSYVLSAGQSIAVDAGGRLLWRDAVSFTGMTFLKQFVSQEYLILFGELPVVPEVDQQGLRQPDRFYDMLVMDRFNGVFLEHYRVGPFSVPVDFSSATMINNHLILSSADRTVVVSGRLPVD